MNAPAPLIAAIQGAPTPIIQALMRDFAASLGPEVRIAGVVEDIPPGGKPDGTDAVLCDIADGRRYTIFQPLGGGSSACGLDGDAVVTACAGVCRRIDDGCDLVVLSKFGRLESERSGLMDAFAAAVSSHIPILTAVSPKFDQAWADFAAPLYVVLPPDAAAIAAWWGQVGQARVE